MTKGTVLFGTKMGQREPSPVSSFSLLGSGRL